MWFKEAAGTFKPFWMINKGNNKIEKAVFVCEQHQIQLGNITNSFVY